MGWTASLHRLATTRPGLVLGLILVLYAALYAPAAGHGFVWDDTATIVHNPQYAAPLLDGLRATQHDHLDASLMHSVELPVAYESYRPLLFASFKLDDAWFQRSARAMHLHNLVLGALCIALAWLVARRLLPTAPAALAATAVFALHPVQTESYCYVSARSDILTALLALAATACALRSTDPAGPARRLGWAALGAVAFFLSLTAKEASAALPVAIALLALALGRLVAAIPALVGLLAAGGAYAAVRVALIGERLSSVDGGSGLLALWHWPALVLTGLRIALAPHDLSIERLAAPGMFASSAGWVLLLGVAALGLAALAGRLRDWSTPVRVASAGIGWFALWLAPSSLAVETMGVFADRYLFAALLGVGIAGAALAPALWRAGRSPQLAPLAAGLWGLALLAVTATQVSVWRDNHTLYAHSALVEPASSMAQYRVGFLHARRGEWDAARRRFERAVELDAQNISALNNLGVAYLNAGRLDDAERLIGQALALSGDLNFRAWNNLASVAFAREQREAGCAALARALSINPDYGFAKHNQRRYCAPESTPTRVGALGPALPDPP